VATPRARWKTGSFPRTLRERSGPRQSNSEREAKGHERAAAVVQPIFCQPVDSIPRRSEKVMAGALNPYGARFTGRAL